MARPSGRNRIDCVQPDRAGNSLNARDESFYPIGSRVLFGVNFIVEGVGIVHLDHDLNAICRRNEFAQVGAILIAHP